jgi:hypothetical protein
MLKTKPGLNLFAALVGILLYASVGEAQATRTWVSGVGDDANPCSRTAPCKTFAGAISKTAASGEISVLDPGGFGAVTITKSITINGEGTLAGILASLTNGIIVNAGVNDVVIIRNVSINGAGNGINGIRYLAGAQLIVENCWIYGFTNNGIDATANAGRLAVKDTQVEDCDSVGIRVTTTGATAASAVLENVRIQSCGFGFDLQSGKGSITRSLVSNISNQALVAEGTSAVNATSCVFTNSGTGVAAFTSGSTVRIADCDITNNTTGISIAVGGTVQSAANNRNAGNTTPGAPNGSMTIQ